MDTHVVWGININKKKTRTTSGTVNDTNRIKLKPHCSDRSWVRERCQAFKFVLKYLSEPASI